MFQDISYQKDDNHDRINSHPLSIWALSFSNRLKHQPTFNTDSGKAHFISHKIDNKEPLTKQLGHTFTLMSVRSEGQFNSIIYEENDSYRNVDQRWSVMMNIDDMTELGIHKKECVDIVSDHGEMKNVLVYPFDLPRSNVMAYYPEANILIGLTRDPRSQTPAFKSVKVSIKQSRK